jgi:hypothetical protein
MLAFLTPLLSFLGGPIINGVITGYKAKLEAGNTKDKLAADLASRELDVQRREIEVQAQLKTAEIGHIMVTYFGKIIIWDKVLGYWTNGSTDAITGDAATWAGMIMAFYVGMRGFENVARILKR